MIIPDPYIWPLIVGSGIMAGFILFALILTKCLITKNDAGEILNSRFILAQQAFFGSLVGVGLVVMIIISGVAIEGSMNTLLTALLTGLLALAIKAYDSYYKDRAAESAATQLAKAGNGNGTGANGVQPKPQTPPAA